MKKNTHTRKKKSWKSYWQIYLMMFPGLTYLIINNYMPMFGSIVAFKKLDFTKGIFLSPWNGFDNFRYLFSSSAAWIITRNTLLYNLVFIILGIFLSITFAILLNEVRNHYAARMYQTVTLLPYLLSWVIVGYLGYAFLASKSGFLNSILDMFGAKAIDWYNTKGPWPVIIIFVYCWKTIGYSMIVYYSSIVGINPDYYEAAVLDGASKWQQIRCITIPLLKSTVIAMFIINLGHVFRSDFGLFYQLPRNSGALYNVTNTIDVYVYNALLRNNNFGLSAAAGFYQAIVGFVLVIAANLIVRKINPDEALF